MLRRVQQRILDNTKKNYNRVAESYARTRDRSWPSGQSIIPELTKRLSPDDHILDLGAGSGILVEKVASLDIPLHYTGYDVSEKLIELARNKFGSQYSQIECMWQVGNALELPFADSVFKHITAVAVLHHIPSVSMRHETLKELYRVCAPGGFVYMTNWYLWTQVTFKKHHLYHQLFLPFKGYDIGDFEIPWKDNTGTVLAKRYVHAFWPIEIDILCRAVGFQVIVATHLEKSSEQSIAQRLVTVLQKPN